MSDFLCQLEDQQSALSDWNHTSRPAWSRWLVEQATLRLHHHHHHLITLNIDPNGPLFTTHTQSIQQAAFLSPPPPQNLPLLPSLLLCNTRDSVTIDARRKDVPHLDTSLTQDITIMFLHISKKQTNQKKRLSSSKRQNSSDSPHSSKSKCESIIKRNFCTGWLLLPPPPAGPSTSVKPHWCLWCVWHSRWLQPSLADEAHASHKSAELVRFNCRPHP